MNSLLRRFCRRVLAVVLVTLLSGALAAERPNIVLVLADDLGIHDLGCYGRGDHRTPNLDRLASQGMRFTSALCAQPICSPSRAALLTGKSPARLHLTQYLPGRADARSQRLKQPRIEGQLPLGEVTLAEVLGSAGYATGIFGKWHLGGGEFGPERQGFDRAFLPPSESEPSEIEGGKSEMAITAEAMKFMELNKDRPFFCFVPHHNPHIPLRTAKTNLGEHAKAYQPMYAAMIRTLDESVGKLMGKLDELGLAGRTIFVFTSDNGGLHVLEFPGTPATYNLPFRAGKGFLYEGGLREPLIVRWPGVTKPGGISDVPVVLTDLVPTLMKAAELDSARIIGPLDGMDMTSVLRGEVAPARRLFWHFPHYTNQGGRPAGAVRDGRWKLIEHFEDGMIELFDLQKDPGERVNLSGSEPGRVSEMLNSLSDWRGRVGAQMPMPNPDFDPVAHRELYVDFDPSNQEPGATAESVAGRWKKWREGMDRAVAGNRPWVIPAKGVVILAARDAKTHGEKLQYEPQPHKNTLGYWVNPADWAEWVFETAQGGAYQIDILQGCGTGSGGSEVEFELDGKAFTIGIVETGHFQHFVRRELGRVTLSPGRHVLTVRAKSKPGPAVMDLREVRLVPEG